MKQRKNLKKIKKTYVGEDFEDRIKKSKPIKFKEKYRHKNHWLEEEDDYFINKQEEE